jgi:hypothetical protein
MLGNPVYTISEIRGNAELADLNRRLIKEWLETGDDNLLHHANQASHRTINLQVRNEGFLERYIGNRLELHVHVFGVGGTVHANHNFCAVSRYGFVSTDCKNVSLSISDLDFRASGANGSESESSVLIDVHELVKNPQRMAVGVKLAGSVRLQSINDCLGLNGYAAKPIATKLTLEAFRREADREHVFLDRFLPVAEDQLPDDVIKSRSKAVQALSYDDAETEIGRRHSQLEKEGLPDFRISLGDNSAIIETPIGFSFDCFEMYFCSDDFLSNSLERMIHKIE